MNEHLNHRERITVNKVNEEWLSKYEAYLLHEERSNHTISKYLHDVRNFLVFLDGRELKKEEAVRWKQHLSDRYAPTSVNSMLAAVNRYLEFSECPECKVKPLKIQRSIFIRQEKELDFNEYRRLVQTAEEKKNRRLSLVIQTICATGIRVSELCYITAEAVKWGRADVDCKGKRRVIFLSVELRRLLRHYCKEEKIDCGIIFRTKNGSPLNRSNIWRDMKGLCKDAGVDVKKVFPHNLRHLFARTYYAVEKDLSRLADLLGHSNINTTRIYTMESGREHVRQLAKMGLVITG